jgi:hypothetical protein
MNAEYKWKEVKDACIAARRDNWKRGNRQAPSPRRPCGDPKPNLQLLTNPLLRNNNTKMTNLDMLLLKAASASSPEEGLHELRYTILTEGIPANSEGMVRSPPDLHKIYIADRRT